MFGRVKYIGPGKYHSVFYGDRGVAFETFGDFLKLPLYKCKVLVDSGQFIPDEKTSKLLLQNGQNDPSIYIENSLDGQECFIIGSGRSLRGFDYTRLDNKFTIALNHSLKEYPGASSVLFVDEKFVDQAIKELKEFKGLIFGAYRSGYHFLDNRSNVYSFSLNRKEPQEKYVFGLYNGSLSGLAAINLALLMGASKIYLLGYDLIPPTEEELGEDGSVHSYNDKSYKNKNNYTNKKWSESRIVLFEKYLPWKDRIFICNLNSGISYFEYKNLEEVLER